MLVRFVSDVIPTCSDVMHTWATIISRDQGGRSSETQVAQLLFTNCKSQADAGGPSACWETPASQLIEQLIGSESTQHDDVLYKLFIDFESEGF